MKLTFCGAAETTTGSQHLLEVNGRRILLDCGFFQGRRLETWERNQHFLFDPAGIDAVILSHAHIDHSGNLPNLCRQGFQGNVYATFATRDLCSIMLPDSARIQAHDVKWINKRRARAGEPLAETIYSEMDAERCLRQFVNIGYGRPMPVADGVTLTFIDAGHILGSAQIILDIDEGGRKRRLLFSGDVGRGGNELLRDPEPAEGVDFLLMESTYGGREHELPAQASEHIASVIHRAIEREGKVIIPAFAVERTQQLIYVLHQLHEAGRIPDVPVYVDSPLAVSATEIFRLHPECFNEEVYRFLFEKRDPFGFDALRFIRRVDDSKRLNRSSDPCVIISASGMCEAGRVLHHLAHNIEDPRNTILFAGYCAENTLGWKIRHREETVNIFGEPYRLRASVEILDSFSGHAGHSELMGYFAAMSGSKERVWLVHGEREHSRALAEALRPLHSGEIAVPRWKETAEF